MKEVPYNGQLIDGWINETEIPHNRYINKKEEEILYKQIKEDIGRYVLDEMRRMHKKRKLRIRRTESNIRQI